MLSNGEMLKLFTDCGGILKGHFLLTSGRHADTYMQSAKLFERSDVAVKLCAELHKKLKGVKVDCVAAPAVGGIIMGFEIARQFGVRNVYYERADGVLQLRRGFEIGKGDKVLIADGTMTTGGSVLEVYEAVKAAGAEPVAFCTVVDRSGGAIKLPLRHENLLSVDVKSFEASDCPLCKEGKIPLVKLGSRKI